MVESERFIKELSNEEFHKTIGGRRRYDLRFFFDEKAILTRELVSELLEERVGNSSVKDISKEIGISEGTLSRAMGGRAGTKVNKNFGMSSADFIVSKLGQIIEKNKIV
ncbi:MAG: hypothetical protein PHO75_03920 [Candidatus Shapirobacteria bacterium]|jgi:hypothetical protein|nr:hypothetical protein [Candidatus Shapirobacteria bacterium]